MKSCGTDQKKDSVTRKDYLYHKVRSAENGYIRVCIDKEFCNYVIYKKCIELVHEKLEFTEKVVRTQAEKMKIYLLEEL